MKGNALQLSNTPWAGKLFRSVQPGGHKRKIVVSATALYAMLKPELSYAEFTEAYIESTNLRSNIDYYYTEKYKNLLLTVSCVQAVLVMFDTDVSWMLFNALTDIISSGFSSN